MQISSGAADVNGTAMASAKKSTASKLYLAILILLRKYEKLFKSTLFMANKHVLYTFFLYRDLKDKIPRTFLDRPIVIQVTSHRM